MNEWRQNKLFYAINNYTIHSFSRESNSQDRLKQIYDKWQNIPQTNDNNNNIDEREYIDSS